MSEQRCANCDIPVKDAALCTQDTENFRLLLNVIPDRLRTMTTTVHKQAVMGKAMKSASTEVALPFHAYAAEKKQELRGRLVQTVLDVKAAFSNTFRHTDVEVLTGWLIAMMPEIRKHPDAGAWHASLSKAYLAATRAIDRPADRIRVGICGARTMEVKSCPAELLAIVGNRTTRCRECGTLWDVRQRQADALEAAQDVVDYPPVIVKALQKSDPGLRVNIKRFENWVQTGVLEYAEVDARGRKMYRVGDVQQVALSKWRRRASKETTRV